MENTAPAPLVEFHADDYGLFPAQSERILACHENGCLNGVSLLVNSPYAGSALETLRRQGSAVSISVHLNLVEGRSMCPREETALLTDGNGDFNISFIKLLVRSFLPGRDKYRRQIGQEFRAQIDAAQALLGRDAPLRLDSHVHYHMIPMVFDSLMDVIRQDGLEVQYIRVPRERLGLYWRHRKQLRDLRPINLVKAAVLNALSWYDLRRYRSYMDGLEKRVFLGVMLSGHMTRQNVEAVLPDAVAAAQALGQGVELLAHPGGVYEKDDIARLTAPDDKTFLTSPDRDREADMFRSIDL